VGYVIDPLPFGGAVDADAHVLEPADLWTEYLEAEFRDRAIRIRRDEEGYEYFEFDGTPSPTHNKGLPGIMGAMGDSKVARSPDRLYMENMPFGACNSVERIDLLNQENVEFAILYPTIGVLWECVVTDADLSLAYTRAYNRWIADFCRDSGGRLVPIAHLSLLDPDAAAAELRRAVADGCRGAFVAGFTHSRTPHGHPDHDPVFQACQSLDVPLTIHPCDEPPSIWQRRFRDTSASIYGLSMAGELIRPAFLSFFNYGVFDRFPNLQVGILESQAGWIGTLLDRLDVVHDTLDGSGLGDAPLKETPSVYFRRQCFISGDPEETALAHIIDHVGADRFVWASDYPHLDHSGAWSANLQRLVGPLSPETRAAFVGANAKAIYRLP
jgi:predicted TIM-barrel fold metal-dependent hydrolase